MYKITTYIPYDSLEKVKQAMFAQGGGKLGHYDCCAWQTRGQGQFRPLAQSNPAVGQKGKLEYIEEYLVEMICEDRFIKSVVKALKQAHPYEEPAYAVMHLENICIK
jgi:structural toxin protein (hemagglutinin/hemolysin) RtxA